jgi:hypothetical protein
LKEKKLEPHFYYTDKIQLVNFIQAIVSTRTISVGKTKAKEQQHLYQK